MNKKSQEAKAVLDDKAQLLDDMFADYREHPNSRKFRRLVSAALAFEDARHTYTTAKNTEWFDANKHLQAVFTGKKK